MGSCMADKPTPEGSRNHMLQDSKEEGCSKGSDSRRLDLIWEGREGAMSMDVSPKKQGGFSSCSRAERRVGLETNHSRRDRDPVQISETPVTSRATTDNRLEE